MTKAQTIAKEFVKWGRRRVLKVRRLIQKYGVLCSDIVWSDGTRG